MIDEEFANGESVKRVLKRFLAADLKRGTILRVQCYHGWIERVTRKEQQKPQYRRKVVPVSLASEPDRCQRLT
jgi:hypothetical protein